MAFYQPTGFSTSEVKYVSVGRFDLASVERLRHVGAGDIAFGEEREVSMKGL
jgi:hypothetical protein